MSLLRKLKSETFNSILALDFNPLLKFQKADNPDEIDIDDDDDDDDDDGDSKSGSESEGEAPDGIQKQAVPSKVFGGLKNADDDDDDDD